MISLLAFFRFILSQQANWLCLADMASRSPRTLILSYVTVAVFVGLRMAPAIARHRTQTTELSSRAGKRIRSRLALTPFTRGARVGKGWTTFLGGSVVPHAGTATPKAPPCQFQTMLRW